jgi:hypothetical protein
LSGRLSFVTFTKAANALPAAFSLFFVCKAMSLQPFHGLVLPFLVRWAKPLKEIASGDVSGKLCGINLPCFRQVGFLFSIRAERFLTRLSVNCAER